MARYSLVIVLLAAVLGCCNPARILSLIPFPGKSHYINIQPIMQELAVRGHDVTVITTQYEKDPLPNYHQIILNNQTFWDSLGTDMDKFSLENMPFTDEMNLLWTAAYYSTEVAFNSTSLQDFIKNDNSHFDLIFIELFFQEAFYMFAHKYKAPMVAMSTVGFTQYLGDAMGNPLEMSYMPHEFFPSRGKLGLWKRLKNVFYTMFDLIGRKYYLLPRHEKLLRKHFTNLAEPLPSLEELERSVSVVLLNTHFTIDTVRPHMPGIIEIGGVHIKPTKKLPEDIQRFLDEAQHGVIFFSLGSNLQSREMPTEKVEMFLRVFGRLKQRVLWKWEDDTLKNKPSNVLIKSWMPQTDILAHPNVRVFITHGGLLSTIEAIHFGIPVIGIPVYGDQHLNAEKAETFGYGIKLAFSSLTEEKISHALDRMVNDDKHTRVAKELSSRFRDRPRSPMDTAIYWIEYVIEHKGATFMRSPALDLQWYESYMVDAKVVIVLFTALVIFLSCSVIKYFLYITHANKQPNSKKNN